MIGEFPQRKTLRPLLRLALISIACLLIGSCDRDDHSSVLKTKPDTEEVAAPVQIQTAGHQRMLALLRDIADRTADEHSYLGSSQARALRKELADLDDLAPDHMRWRIHFALGMPELQLGNEQKAIDHLTKAHSLISYAGIIPKWANQNRFQLAVAFLRFGETQNCCLRNTPESCLMPIRGKGVHTKQEGSRKAIKYLMEVLDNTSPNDSLHLVARWLLNIAYMTIGGYADEVPQQYAVPPAAFASDIDFPRFNNIASKLSLDSFNLAGGAIVDDFDGDHDLDIVTSTWDTSGPMHFFRNNGDGTFTDRTVQAGLADLLGGLNLIQADYDNNGTLDILVLRGAWIGAAGQHPNSLLSNNGNGIFTDVTFAAGLGDVHYPTQTGSWADYDNDGDLDLYIGNESTKGFSAPCQLFKNNGDGTFTDMADVAGVLNDGFAKAAIWGDFDDDSLPDLYVSNYARPNRLYHNNGDGTFSDIAPQAGVTKPLNSFPGWFWDYDNDGVLDLFVSSYTYPSGVGHVAAHYLGMHTGFERGCLYRGNGQGGFEDVTLAQNLNYPLLTMGSNFGDLNNDGYLDFYLGTGNPQYETLTPNLMFLNQRGEGFANVTTAGGFGHLQKGHGVAFADIDNDGDVDVFEQMGGAYPGDKFGDALYENTGFGNHWISVKLVGRDSNRSAIGARIHVRIKEKGKIRSIYKHVNSGGSFGCNPLRQTVGLGQSESTVDIEVYWPTTGQTQLFRDVAIDQFIQIVEGEDKFSRLMLNRVRLGSKSNP